MKAILFSVVLALSISVAAAVPEMPVSYLAEPKAVLAVGAQTAAARYPDADCVVLDDRVHTRFEPDGSDLTWEDEWVKVLTEKGRRSLARVSLGYNERYGDAGILCVEVVGVDGQVRTIDFAQTLKVATDNASMSANIYDPLDKTVSCAVPGLAVGEIRHVRTYRRTRKARMRDTWADMNLLEYTYPILATTITVDQPAGRPVKHAVVRNPFGSTVTRAPDKDLGDGRTLLSWTARDVPQAFTEPKMPSFSRCVQALILSTADDWPTVSRWYWRMCEDHLAKTTPAMTNQVVSLVKDCTTEEQKIRALFKFVSQEVRYMGLTLEGDAPGYEPHDVNVTFDNRYGVCRDKAALLAALLRIAGVKAYPVLIHAGAKMDPEAPTPYFNHAIVGVEQGAGKYQLMDPTDESSKDLCPAYLSDKSYLVARPEGERLLTSPVAPVSQNLMQVASDGTLDAEGALLLTTQFTFTGINDTSIRHALLRKTPEERRQYFASIVRAVYASAELLSLEILPADLRDTETKLTAKTIARFPDFVLRGKTRDTFNLPLVSSVFNIADNMLGSSTALVKRRFPLELSCTAGSEETLRLVLGDAVGAPLALPPDVKAQAGGAADAPKYAFARTVGIRDGVLTATRKLHVTDVNFSVPEYADLRSAREQAETGERASPRFAARADNDANVHIRRDEAVVHLQSPTAWVQTNIVEKEILTYQGKKAASELKFTYAPCTRGIEIVSATVTNKDGKELAVTPKEINEMDCGWASGAPRYPASKILVVNLPGVEIGSVIRTVVATTVTNAPVAYAATQVFGGRDPVDYEAYELHVPHGLRFAEPRVSESFRTAEGRAWKVESNETARVFTWAMTKPAREPNETLQPPARLWRPTIEVSTADWAEHGRALVQALDAAYAAGHDEAAKLGRAASVGIAKRPGEAPALAPETRLQNIRLYLAHHLRVAGPGLFEVPFARAFTAPDTVLAQGYGSDADRMNLARAMFEAAGFTCSFVLATSDAHGFRRTEAENRAVPHVGAYGSLLLRVEWREKGWIPFLGGTTRTFWYGGENEYTPVQATAWCNDGYYDPAADAFGRIALDAAWAPGTVGRYQLAVRANGAVDFTVVNETYGAAVGPLRKQFSELVPELRARYYQQLVSGLAQNATATRELETDVTGYPFTLSFAAYAEGFAVVKDDTISLELPAFGGRVFNLAEGPRRRSPLALGGQDSDRDTFEVVFPQGYTEIESLPPPFQVADPHDPAEVWLVNTVEQQVVDGCLHVTVTRTARREAAVQLGADFAPYLKDWNKRAASLEARTLTVRRSK